MSDVAKGPAMTADAKGQTDVSVIYRSILASLKELRPEMSVVERFALTVTLSANAARDMRAAFGVAPDLVKALEEAKAKIDYLVDNIEYSDSYGVPGSDFGACHLCHGGGAPGIPLVHEPHCPVVRCESVVAELWNERNEELKEQHDLRLKLEGAEKVFAALEGDREVRPLSPDELDEILAFQERFNSVAPPGESSASLSWATQCRLIDEALLAHRAREAVAAALSQKDHINER